MSWTARGRSILFASLSLVIVAAAPVFGQEPPDTSRPALAASEVEIGSLYLTRPGYSACLDRDRFEDLMAAVARGESETYRKMLENPKESGCFLLKGALEVRLEDARVTYVELKPTALDLTFWTVTEALSLPGVPEPPR